MKRHYLHTLGISVITFVLTICVLTGCEHFTHDDDCAELLHDAGVDLHEMHYVDAIPKLKKVMGHANNRMHRMSADIMMMRLCMMTGQNKEFFDYRADAEECMRVLQGFEEHMEGRNLQVWHYLQASYCRVSAYYFGFMRQRKELHEMLDKIANNPSWQDGDELGFDQQIEPEPYIRTRRMVRVADYFCDCGFYQEALDTLAVALHLINNHHIYNNKGLAPDDTLTLTGAISDAVSKEMEWIANPDIIAVPDWMASVREELSIVYGAMGDKESSNYNRNIYFDILDASRQDTMMKQRQADLSRQSQLLNVFIVLLTIFAIVVALAVAKFAVSIRKQSHAKAEKLKLCLDLCDQMTKGENIDSAVYDLIPNIEGDWTTADVSRLSAKPYEREMLSLLQVFNGWIAQNTEMFNNHIERKESIEGEIYMEQRRMDDNKRRHTDRSTAISIVQGITPFLDRAIHQVEKGAGYADRELLRQFVEKINAYNDVLGHWVKVRQGSVILNIENFELAPLLDILRKGHRAFENKNISLSIEQTDAVVKADKALTMFMMNTLLDNARKYTPEGGSVSLKLTNADDYVEISVVDTGKGLSAEDQDKINNMKVYDSSQIGLDNDQDGSIKQNKGFGFGLMNCRGIIEKYRKTSRMFNVCQFGVESTLDVGSRFYFRLPKGVKRMLSLLLLMVLSFKVSASPLYDYIDSIYFANINGEYQRTLEFAQLAIDEINHDFTSLTGRKSPLMKLCDERFKDASRIEFAELEWYADSVDMDYNMIIQLRNEVILASLSLHDKLMYRYNNEAFIRLNKVTTNDPMLENDCKHLAYNNDNKNLILTLSFIIILIACSTFALLYYHHTVLPVFNMRQLIDFLKRLFTAQPDSLPSLTHQAVSSIHSADAVNVTLKDGRKFFSGSGECRTHLPLHITFEGEEREIGTMHIAYHGSEPSSAEKVIIDFYAKFVSIHTFFASVKVEQLHDIIELLEEQRFAAETEQQRLHVQNMVLDNCLSTIKHETMYYPNRILQLLDTDSELNLDEIRDVLRYYREVFSLLSENANRQLSRSIVKLQKVSLAEVARYAKRSFEKQNKKLLLPLHFSITGNTEGSVRADIILLQYLLDTLLSLAFESKSEGNIQLNFDKSEGFIKFALSDSRLSRSDEESAELFYADSVRYDAGTDTLQGAQYLIAKQIIRAHDERLGHSGCRISADTNNVVFTLPIA